MEASPWACLHQKRRADAISGAAWRHRFYLAIAISDGTLVQGRFDNWVDECRFSIAVEGAGITTISRAERGDVLDLAWKIEWISVAIARDMRCAKRSGTPQMQRELSFTDAGKIAT